MQFTSWGRTLVFRGTFRGAPRVPVDPLEPGRRPLGSLPAPLQPQDAGPTRGWHRKVFPHKESSERRQRCGLALCNITAFRICTAMRKKIRKASKNTIWKQSVNYKKAQSAKMVVILVTALGVPRVGPAAGTQCMSMRSMPPFRVFVEDGHVLHAPWGHTPPRTTPLSADRKLVPSPSRSAQNWHLKNRLSEGKKIYTDPQIIKPNWDLKMLIQVYSVGEDIGYTPHFFAPTLRFLEIVLT